MALETTKSLNFADLDLTGNERYNTVGSQRQVIKTKLNNGFSPFFVVPVEVYLIIVGSRYYWY